MEYIYLMKKIHSTFKYEHSCVMLVLCKSGERSEMDMPTGGSMLGECVDDVYLNQLRHDGTVWVKKIHC
jgi:hypothetical protein